MTREEAIKFANSLKNNYTIDFDDMADFCNMSIKALEQQPSENCVDREELKKWLDMNFSFGGALRKIELFDRLDKELQPVTPTRKKGKWLSAEEYALKIGAEVTEDIKNSLYKFCPFCEQTVFMERNYCPNCGAEMEIEE